MAGVGNGLPARLWQQAVWIRAVRTGVTCTCLLVVVYLLAVWTKAGQLFEDTVLDAAGRPTTTGAALRAGATLRTINHWSVAGALLVIVGAAAARRRPVLGLLAAAVVGASIATAEVVQRALLRPILLPHGIRREDQSFPSGHTSVAVSVMCALVLVAPRRYRLPVAVLGGVLGAAFAAATITAGWHRPSDTLGSDLIALLYACATVALLAARGRVCPEPPVGRRRHGYLLRIAGSVLGIAAGLLVLNRLGGVGSPASLPLSVARTLAVAGSLGVALTLVLLLRGFDLAAPADSAARARELRS